MCRLADHCARKLGALGAARDGVSIIEFALILPILLTLGLFGAEVAYMTIVDMQVSMISTSLADNASRLGQTDNSSVTPTVTESEVNSIMTGALREGRTIDFETNGRIILSSLEYDATKKRQYIHWQRCVGDLDRDSSYGEEGAGLTGQKLESMGSTGHSVTASDGIAVMFVEIFYSYQPLFGSMFVSDTSFHHEAAYIMRDDRNLTPGITGSGSTASCD